MQTDYVQRFLFEDLDIRGRLVCLTGAWQRMLDGRGLPRRYRSSARSYHRAQRPFGGEPEGLRAGSPSRCKARARSSCWSPTAPPSCGSGAWPATKKPAERLQRTQPAGRRPALRDAGGREERPVLPEPGAAGRRDASSRSSSTTCRSRSRPPRSCGCKADGGALCGLLLEKLPRADARDPDGWNRVTHLASTLTLDETRDAQPYDLLTRVFPEELMRVFRLYAVEYHCPYDESKVKDMLLGLGPRGGRVDPRRAGRGGDPQRDVQPRVPLRRPRDRRALRLSLKSYKVHMTAPRSRG